MVSQRFPLHLFLHSRYTSIHNYSNETTQPSRNPRLKSGLSIYFHTLDILHAHSPQTLEENHHTPLDYSSYAQDGIRHQSMDKRFHPNAHNCRWAYLPPIQTPKTEKGCMVVFGDIGNTYITSITKLQYAHVSKSNF